MADDRTERGPEGKLESVDTTPVESSRALGLKLALEGGGGGRGTGGQHGLPGGDAPSADVHNGHTSTFPPGSASVRQSLPSRRVLALTIAGTVAAIIAVIAWAQLPSDSGAVDPTRWLGLLPGLGGGPGWARAAAAVFVVASLATLAALWWLLQRWAGYGWVSSRLARLTWLAWSLPFVLGPPLASRDVWAYAAQGTLAQRGFDPARVPVSALGPGPLLAAVDPRWRETRPPYGGFAVLLERVGVVLGGGSQLGTVLALRAIAVASVVVMVLGAAQLVRAELRPRTILLIGCNPIVLIHLVSGAHLDAAAAALLVAGLLVADRGHRCAGVALCCLAGTVKFPAFLGAVWLTAAAVHQVWQARAARAQPPDRPAGHPTSRGPAVLPLLARDGTVALGTVVVTTAAGSGLAWLHNLGTPGQLRTGVAPVDAFAHALSSAGGVVGWHPGEPSVLRVSRLAGAAVAMGVALWLVLRPPPRRSDGGATTGQVRVPAGGLSANALPVGRLAAGLAALALLGPVLYPWYLAPAIALLAIGGPRARQVLIVATLALLAAALPSMRPLAEAPELAFALSLGLLAGAGLVLAALAPLGRGRPALEVAADRVAADRVAAQ